MNATARNRWDDMEDDPGFIAHEMLSHDVYTLPEEDDSFVFCPECGEMAPSFVFIEHKRWCAYGENSMRELYGLSGPIA